MTLNEYIILFCFFGSLIVIYNIGYHNGKSKQQKKDFDTDYRHYYKTDSPIDPVNKWFKPKI